MNRQLQYKRHYRNLLRKSSLTSFFLCLMIHTHSFLMIQSAEIYSGTSTADSLNLVYNSIEATDFPNITSFVTVMNDVGLIVGKLDTSNFKVFEDGIRELPIDVIELPEVDIGVHVVLVIDRSGSMKGQKIEDAKAAAITFVELMQSKDQSAIVSFSDNIRTDYSFTNQKDSLIAAISKLTAQDDTAIFDAVIHSISLMGNDAKNRAIILLTDGNDNSSQHTFQEALTACLAHEVRVFSIGLGLDRNSKEENILKEFAAQTGGLYYYSPTSGDLAEIYRAISQILHHRYQISYATHNPAKDGTLRHVRIEVDVNHNTSADTASYRAPYEDPTPPPPPTDDPQPSIPPADPPPPEEPSVEDEFKVLPNPFTPNDDGFNDRVEFKNGVQNWDVIIMDRNGKIVKRLSNGECYWDGKDSLGQLVYPGNYLYMVSDGNRVLYRGLVQLIR